MILLDRGAAARQRRVSPDGRGVRPGARPARIAAGVARRAVPAEVLALPALRDVELEGQLLVRDLMRVQAVALRPDDRSRPPRALLQRHGVDALPVVGDAGAAGRACSRTASCSGCWCRRTCSG